MVTSRQRLERFGGAFLTALRTVDFFTAPDFLGDLIVLRLVGIVYSSTVIGNAGTPARISEERVMLFIF